MIIVIVRHTIQPGMLGPSRKRLATNAERMMQQPGILFRHTGENDDGREFVTVTGWESEQHRLAWDEARKASPPSGAMSDYYSDVSAIDVRVFDERSTHNAA